MNTPDQAVVQVGDQLCPCCGGSGSLSFRSTNPHPCPYCMNPAIFIVVIYGDSYNDRTTDAYWTRAAAEAEVARLEQLEASKPDHERVGYAVEEVELHA
jgi:hypothetical protein